MRNFDVPLSILKKTTKRAKTKIKTKQSKKSDLSF